MQQYMVQHLECHLLQWRIAPLECCQLFLYSSWADSLHALLSHVILNDHEWLQTFLSLFVCSFVRNIRQSVFTALSGCYATGATWSCCYLSMFCVHHTTMHQFTVSLQAVAVTRAQCTSRISLGCTVVYGTCLECLVYTAVYKQHNVWNVWVHSSMEYSVCGMSSQY